MEAIQVISVILLSVLAANAQVIMPGRCPRPAVQENFDVARVRTISFPFLSCPFFSFCFLLFPFPSFPFQSRPMVMNHQAWLHSSLCHVPPLQYLGTWFDVQRLPHAFQRGECCTATYSLKSPGVVGVLNRELLWVLHLHWNMDMLL